MIVIAPGGGLDHSEQFLKINFIEWHSLSGCRIVGNFQGRKLLRISNKYDFRGENFHGLLAFAMLKDTTPQISQRKLSQLATKGPNSRKFSPSNVSCCTVVPKLRCCTRIVYTKLSNCLLSQCCTNADRL